MDVQVLLRTLFQPSDKIPVNLHDMNLIRDW